MMRELLNFVITALFIPTALAAQSAVPAQQQFFIHCQLAGEP